jgi:histone demethylase
MDALQAYICAVQLDKCHSAAWANLGILYESCGQARDAYACYLNSNRGLSNRSSTEDSFLPSKLPRLSLSSVGMNPHLSQRISFLQSNLANAPMPSVTSQRRQLLSIEEAWNLPISAEMSSRQQQQNTSQQTKNNSQTYQKNFSQGSTPQGPPPPYPSPGGGAAKQFKTETVEQKTTPQPPPPPPPQQPHSYTLSHHQLHMLNYLQQNINNLSPAQENMRLQLQHQHRQMQQQQQLRHQRQGGAVTPARQGSTPPAYNGNNHFQGQSPQDVTSPLNAAKTLSPTNGDKLVQPSPNVIPSCARDITMPVSGQHSADMDVSEEELKDFLSQKDLATTLAENLLKHFGSDAIDIKEEPDQSENILSSGPFSPSNLDSSGTKQEIDSKKRIKSPTHDSILTIKSEPPWEVDSMHSVEKRPEIEYSIDMDAKTILRLCK